MVKSVCEVAAPKAKPFPLLAKATNSGCIYLMSSSTEGTVVVGLGSDNRPLGYHSDELVSVYSKNNWTILDSGSTVTLTQE